jgi:hypothetical protein
MVAIRGCNADHGLVFLPASKRAGAAAPHSRCRPLSHARYAGAANLARFYSIADTDKNFISWRNKQNLRGFSVLGHDQFRRAGVRVTFET